MIRIEYVFPEVLRMCFNVILQPKLHRGQVNGDREKRGRENRS